MSGEIDPESVGFGPLCSTRERLLFVVVGLFGFLVPIGAWLDVSAFVILYESMDMMLMPATWLLPFSVSPTVIFALFGFSCVIMAAVGGQTYDPERDELSPAAVDEWERENL